MPIYEYECGQCGCLFEKRQSFNDDSIVKCPECQGNARRIIHSVPIIFKGSGFYSTDNRHNNSSVAKETPKTR